MIRQKVLVVFFAFAVCEIHRTEARAQTAVPVSFRNILRQGGITAQFEQLDAQGVVVGLTQQRIGNGAIGTITVRPGTRFNIRVLPDGGGGHVFTNRDLANDSKDNAGDPLDLDGKFDPVTGRRIAIAMRIGSKEIVAPRMEYGGTEYGREDTSNVVMRRGIFGRRCRR